MLLLAVYLIIIFRFTVRDHLQVLKDCWVFLSAHRCYLTSFVSWDNPDATSVMRLETTQSKKDGPLKSYTLKKFPPQKSKRARDKEETSVLSKKARQQEHDGNKENDNSSSTTKTATRTDEPMKETKAAAPSKIEDREMTNIKEQDSPSKSPASQSTKNEASPTKDSLEKGKKSQIQQISKDSGEVLATFTNVHHAAKICNLSQKTIKSFLLGKSKGGGGFIWKRIPVEGSEADSPAPSPKTKLSEPAVEQVSLETQEVIATFESPNVASQRTHISKKKIMRCLRGETKQAGGFNWRKVDADPDVASEVSPKKSASSKQDEPKAQAKSDDKSKPKPKSAGVVQQLSKDSQKVIGVFTNIIEASKASGVERGSIGRCINGKAQSAGGFLWKRISNSDEKSEENTEKSSQPSVPQGSLKDAKESGKAVETSPVEGNKKAESAAQSEVKSQKQSKFLVEKLSLDSDEVLGKFQSIGEASRQSGVGRGSIGQCTNGRAKTAGGFRWRKVYLDDDDKPPADTTNAKTNEDNEKKTKDEVRPRKDSINSEGDAKRGKGLIEQLARDSDEVLGTFSSAKEAGEKTGVNAGNISSCTRGKLQSAGGFRWRRVSEDERPKSSSAKLSGVGSDVASDVVADKSKKRKSTSTSEEASKKPKVSKDTEASEAPKNRFLEQLALDSDKVIATFHSLSQAEEATGVPKKEIRAVLKGKSKSAKGFRWRLVILPDSASAGKQASSTTKASSKINEAPTEKNGNEKSIKKSRSVKLPVEQVSKDSGKVIATFASPAEAADATGAAVRSIKEVLKGKQKTCNGFEWRYLGKSVSAAEANEEGPDDSKKSHEGINTSSDADRKEVVNEAKEDEGHKSVQDSPSKRSKPNKKKIEKEVVDPLEDALHHLLNVDKSVEMVSLVSGEALKAFPTASEAHMATKVDSNEIMDCCLGKIKSAGGYRWRFAGSKDPLDDHIVEQVDLKTGDVLATFQSAAEAEKATGVPRKSISRCCRKKQNTTGGFNWRFKNSTSSDDENAKADSEEKAKPIEQSEPEVNRMKQVVIVFDSPYLLLAASNAFEGSLSKESWDFLHEKFPVKDESKRSDLSQMVSRNLEKIDCQLRSKS